MTSIFELAQELKIPLIFHSESGTCIETHAKMYEPTIQNHHRIRNRECAVKSTEMVLNMAEEYSCTVYFAHVSTAEEIDLIKKAKESGLAWIGIQNSNHAGAAGVYVAMTLSHDLIGIYMAVANANHMPPWGGTDMLLSTNPIAFSIPAGEEDPIVLDIATTETSYGKVKVYADMDKEMPVGWMLNKDGTPLTDPKKASEGFLLPIGRHKGYGLNLIVGMMAGVMNQANFGSNVIDFNANFKSPTNTGQAFFAIKPNLFQSLESFKKETDIRIREIKNSTPMDPSNPVQIPGHMAVQREKEMRRNGVPVSEKTTQLLSELEKKYNTKVPFHYKGA